MKKHTLFLGLLALVIVTPGCGVIKKIIFESRKEETPGREVTTYSVSFEFAQLQDRIRNLDKQLAEANRLNEPVVVAEAKTELPAATRAIRLGVEAPRKTRPLLAVVVKEAGKLRSKSPFTVRDPSGKGKTLQAKLQEIRQQAEEIGLLLAQDKNLQAALVEKNQQAAAQAIARLKEGRVWGAVIEGEPPADGEATVPVGRLALCQPARDVLALNLAK